MDSTGLPTRLPSPARRAFKAAGYTRLEQLTAVSEDELEKLHGVGPKAVRIVREALEDRGLSFAHRKASE